MLHRSILNKSSLIVKKSLTQNKYLPKVSFSQESYTESQIKKGRPVSPHVTIYKFPVVAVSSITNRVTGVLLSAGVTGIGALALVGYDVPSVLTVIGSIPVIAPLAKFSVVFPLTYHYLGGVRHLVWDRIPENLINNESVEQSSYVLFGLSLGISVLLSFI